MFILQVRSSTIPATFPWGRVQTPRQEFMQAPRPQCLGVGPAIGSYHNDDFTLTATHVTGSPTANRCDTVTLSNPDNRTHDILRLPPGDFTFIAVSPLQSSNRRLIAGSRHNMLTVTPRTTNHTYQIPLYGVDQLIIGNRTINLSEIAEPVVICNNPTVYLLNNNLTTNLSGS